jgi:hypothetical protein
MDKSMFAQLMASAPPVPNEFEPTMKPPPKLDADAILALGTAEEQAYIKEALYAGAAYFRGSEKYNVRNELKAELIKRFKAYEQELEKYKDALALARMFQWPVVYAESVIEFYNCSQTMNRCD